MSLTSDCRIMPMRKAGPVVTILLVVACVLRLTFVRSSLEAATGFTLGASNITSDLTSDPTLISIPPTVNRDSYITANISSSIKVAVMVETRNMPAIIPLVLHFSAVLGPDWPVVIYTFAENVDYYNKAPAIARQQKSGRIIIRALQNGVHFPKWNSVSYFLTTPWLWEDLAPAEHILMFQSDSVLCANSVRSVEDFFEYDLIGAPIASNFGKGYNGGLSLRKRSSMLRVIDVWKPFKGERHPEDQWFYMRLRDLEREEVKLEKEKTINLPSMEIARTFAVETIDYPNPLGLHQATRYIKSHLVSLDEWCPEYKLATTTRIS